MTRGVRRGFAPLALGLALTASWACGAAGSGPAGGESETGGAAATPATSGKCDPKAKPADMSFTLQDMNGREVKLSDYTGKVVLLNFWATWCGPCIAEMPKMKKLYAEYKDKGVEFIGVSLDAPPDEGGFDALKKYVADNEISWPQYYQGKAWESDFSASWGINAIPAVFVVAPDGSLHSTQARGKLEQLIPDLLKKAGAATAAGGQ